MHLLSEAARRIAPWRSTDWRLLFIESIVLMAAGGYLLADGERAEFILGAITGLALLGDGLRQWFRAFRRIPRGRQRDLILIRGAIGVAAGGLLLVLLLVQQITVVGVRIVIGIGGLAYALLGLVLIAPAIRSREATWTGSIYIVLLALVSLLLLYRVATADSIAGLLAVTAWLVIGSGIAVGLAGVVRLAGLTRARNRAVGDVPAGDVQDS